LADERKSNGRWNARVPGARLLAGLDVRLVALTALFGVTTMRTDPLVNQQWLQTAVSLGCSQVIGFLVVGFAFVLLRALPRAPRPVLLAVAVCAGALIGRAILMRNAAGDYANDFPGGPPTYWTLVWFFARHSIVYWGFLAAAWYFTQRADERRHALHESRLRRRALDARLTQARIQVLQAQVEPHFLFNTLAHLGHLYRSNAELGRRMLDRLCDYLQSALPHMRGVGTSTLGSELALVTAYLDVQRIRMGDRLAVHIDVPERVRAHPFPPMMLASLVENAIKHGLDALPEGGAVRLAAAMSDGGLRVTVADSGRGFSANRGTGVGLANIRARLTAEFGPAGRMTLASQAPHGVRATIEIPAALSPTAGHP
jgi:signal transduction histidine kinase